MKTIVLNSTGGTGKTTLCVHMLYPRMGCPPYYAVETLNETAEMFGIKAMQMSSDEWLKIQREALILDNMLLDIGSTHTEGLIDKFVRIDGAQAEYDYFVLPVVPTAKAMQETASMLAVLASLEVDPERIRLLFNRVAPKIPLHDQFSPLLAYIKKTGVCTVNTAATIMETELFDMLHDRHLTINALMADEHDYKSMARAIGADGDKKIRLEYSTIHLMQAMARKVQINLDEAYEALYA